MRVSWHSFDEWLTSVPKASADSDDFIPAAIGVFMGALMVVLMLYAIAVARGWTGNY